MPSCEIIGYRFAARINYRLEQDITKNQSLVHITGLELRSMWAGAAGSCWVTGNISIGGTQAARMWLSNTESCGVALSESYFGGGEGTWSGFASSDVVISHGVDGSGEMKVGLDLTVRLTNGTILDPGINAVITVALPKIPRVSEAAAAPVELGQEMVIRLARAAARFRDTVTWRCGGASGTIAVKTGAETLRWTPPVSLCEQVPNRANAPIVLTVTSFDGNTALGSREVTVLCRIPENIVPTVQIAVEDRMGYVSRHGGYIRTQSQARVRTTAAGAYSSTIAEIAVNCGGLLGYGADVSFALEQSGSVPITVTVTDTRGRKAVRQTAITVLPYEKPSVTIRDAYRCSAEGVSQPDGDYLKLIFDAAVTAVENGTASYRALRQVHGGTASGESVLTQYANQFRVTGGSVVMAAGADSSYDCTILVTDSFQTVPSTPALVPVAFVLLDFSRSTRAVGIGMRAKMGGKVNIGLDADFGEHRAANLADPESAQDAATKAYVDAQIAAVKRALGIS